VRRPATPGYISGVTRDRPAPPFLHALLGVIAAALLWLGPAIGERHVPRGSVRARDAAQLAGLDALRTPERIEVAPRLVPVTPARGTTGSFPFAAVAVRATRAHATAAAPRAPRFGVARPARPRRLAFPTEATAPPRALSS
jgi:hypothetical protein